MLAPGRLSDGTPAASDGAVYAGGLTLDGPWIKHGGAGEGFKNMVAWLPEGRLAIHILCNNGAVIPSKMVDRVVDAIGGYPAIYAATTAFAGRYATDDLPVVYALKPIGADRLSVSIEPKPGALGDKRMLELTKSGDGAYQGKSFKIVMDNDRRGFVLGDDRSRVGTFHFSRVD